MLFKQKLSLSALLMPLFALLLLSCSERESFTKSVPEAPRFQSLTDKHFAAPTIEEISLTAYHPEGAIWGATGRDTAGNVFIGVSSKSASAHLWWYDPLSQRLTPQSDTLSQLKRAGLYKEGMSQIKLHSKFVQARDGYLYFSSFDEQGESQSKGVNPTWGGHLWRKRPEDNDWQHLFASEDALIAVMGHGRYIYALGYWGHVLYQYDTEKKTVSGKKRIGSVNGHVSRNFLVDHREHVYVPRILRSSDGVVQVTLVELNTEMVEVAEHRLLDYWGDGNYGGHGILAYTEMLNGDLYFTTYNGGLYRLVPEALGASRLDYFGQFEPAFASSYIASLFSPDGSHLLVALARKKDTNEHYWLIRELQSEVTVNYPLPQLNKRGLMLYGTHTQDLQGNLYVVGTQLDRSRKFTPVLLKLTY